MSHRASGSGEEPLYIGYVPGDPTVPPLSATIPAPMPSLLGNKMLDLREMDMASLAAEAAAANPADPFEFCKIPVTPGVPRAQLACYTGHARSEYSSGGATRNGEQRRPYRRQQRRLSASEIAAVVGAAVAKPGIPIPWSQLGYDEGGPVVGGKEVDLRQLWDLVTSWGGFEGVRAARKWSAIATAMGADAKAVNNHSTGLKLVYERFLLPYELGCKTEKTPSEKDAPARTEVVGGGEQDGMAW